MKLIFEPCPTCGTQHTIERKMLQNMRGLSWQQQKPINIEFTLEELLDIFKADYRDKKSDWFLVDVIPALNKKKEELVFTLINKEEAK